MRNEIDYQLWIRNILDVLEIFASEEFQTRVWVVGDGPECSSYVEAVCQFFDDYQCDLLINKEWKRIGLTEVQRNALEKFRQVIDNFNKHMPENPDDAYVLSQADWPNIRILAQSALDTF